MKQLVYILLCSINWIAASAQELVPNPATFNTAGQGDLYIDNDSIYYIGLRDGTLKEIGIVTQLGTSPDEVLSWNATTQQWEPKAPQLGALNITKEFIQNAERARVQIAPVTSIVSNSGAITPLSMSTIQLNEMGLSASGNNISGLEGNLRFIVQVNLRSNNERTNFSLRMNVNGTLNQKQFGSLYARNFSGHNETGAQFIFDYESASTTDNFSFEMEGEAVNGTVRLVSDATTTSYIFVEQFSSVEVVTSASAPTDMSIAQGPQGPVGPQGPQGPAGASISSPTDVYHASGNIASNGTANYIQGATVSRLSQGKYRVTFSSAHSNGADYPVLIAMEQNAGDDDYVPAYDNVTATSFDVEIGEQDNGGNPGAPRDAGFSFYIPL